MTPLRVFVLDDCPERQAAFAERFGSQFLVQAWNYYEAVALLSAWPPFDLWFLDHDLGTRSEAPKGSLATWPHAAPPWEMTGLDVAKWAARCLEQRRPKRVVIHSWNQAGAEQMRRVFTLAQFQDVICSPFNTRELREKEWAP